MNPLQDQLDSRPAMSLKEGLPTDNMSRYHVGAKSEIHHLFRVMAERRVFIRAHFANQTYSFLTTVIDVDIEKNQLILDAPSESEMIDRLSHYPQLSLSTTVDGIQIEANVLITRRGMFEDHPALYVHIPASLLRLQRRESYRLNTPIATPVICQVPGEDGILHTYDVYDISVGGAAILNLPNARLGSTLIDARILLPDEGLIMADLSVRNTFDMTMKSGTVIRRVGCAFLGLLPGMQNMIQRYILRAERERKARREMLA